MMSNLFLCKTPMQVLRAVQLAYYKEPGFENSSICVFRTFGTADIIVKKIAETNIFDSVQIFDNSFKTGKAVYFQNYYSSSAFSEYISTCNCDSLTIFNSDSIDSFLAYNILRKKSNVCVRYVEDAPMIYSYNIPSKKNVIVGKLLGLKFPILEICEWYFSAPEKMRKTNNARSITLKSLDRNDSDFVNVLNYIYGYEPDEALDSADIVIMEESFYTDKIIQDNSDLNIFMKIKDSFPEDRIAVKLHPRTKVNRFENNFIMIENAEAPWEIFLLNQNMEDKVFISIACSTMVSPKLLFGDENKCILLYPFFVDKMYRANGEKYFNSGWINSLSKLPEIYSDKTRIVALCEFNAVIDTITKWKLEK